MKSRVGLTNLLKVIGFLLFLSGLAFLFITFITSRSSNPVVFNKYSLSLALTILTLGVLIAGGFIFAILRPERTESVLKAIITRAGRIPSLLELTVAYGWIPVIFLLVAGRILTPIAGELSFITGLGLLYLSWVVLAVAASSRERRKALFERLLLLGITTVLGLVAIELTLRSVSPGSVFSPEIELIPNLRLQLEVDLRGMSPVAIHTTNSWGLRGEEPPSDWDDWFTIVTIGGSTTHCYFMDDSNIWPRLLQEELRETYKSTWVGNGGLPGHSTRAHISFMRDIIPVISPDMVILLVGANDVAFSTRKARSTFTVLPLEQTSFRYKIFACSRLIQVLYRWIQIHFGEVHVLDMNIPPYEPEQLDGPEMELPDDIRELCTSLDEYRSNIRTIIQLGRESGVQVVFMTQPHLWENTEYWCGIKAGYYWEESDESRLSAATYSRIYEVFNQELRLICMEESVPCLDLASLIPHSHDSFYDGVHFTEIGAAQVAGHLSRFMLDESLVQLQ